MSLASVLMLIVTHSPVAALPVQCSVSLANKDAFWYDIEEVYLMAVRTIMAFSVVTFGFYSLMLCENGVVLRVHWR